jgi:hypothetical protein
MNIKIIIRWIVMILSLIGVLYWLKWAGWKGAISFMMGSFITAFLIIWYLYKKSDIVKAGMSMFEEKIK